MPTSDRGELQDDVHSEQGVVCVARARRGGLEQRPIPWNVPNIASVWTETGVGVRTFIDGCQAAVAGTGRACRLRAVRLPTG